MARTHRKKSGTGFYHVIVRGVAKQVLFEDRKDYLYYLSILEKYSTKTNITICAYCLMENHVHLLLSDENDQLPLLMKQLGVCYSQHYNRKYDRCGHLFQNRYLSEPVETSASLLIVFRYILRNPQKAGICRLCDYEWSSFQALRGEASFTDCTDVIVAAGGRSELLLFVNSENDDDGLEYDRRPKDDEWALRKIQSMLGIPSGTMLQSYSKEERNAAIRLLKETGMSLRQIARLTGVGLTIVRRA